MFLTKPIAPAVIKPYIKALIDQIKSNWVFLIQHEAEARVKDSVLADHHRLWGYSFLVFELFLLVREKLVVLFTKKN